MEVVDQEDLRAGEDFTLIVQCDSNAIGRHVCAEMYQIHLRGPIAYSVPANPVLYRHDQQKGRTEILVNVNQAGRYEIWAWPDWPKHDDCPGEQNVQTPRRMIQGSGDLIVRIKASEAGEVDGLRQCVTADYATSPKGRWVSLNHIRGKYLPQVWVQSHMKRAGA